MSTGNNCWGGRRGGVTSCCLAGALQLFLDLFYGEICELTRCPAGAEAACQLSVYTHLGPDSETRGAQCAGGPPYLCTATCMGWVDCGCISGYEYMGIVCCGIELCGIECCGIACCGMLTGMCCCIWGMLLGMLVISVCTPSSTGSRGMPALGW